MASGDGWVKILRKIREHAVWDHDGVFKLFVHCVLEANYAPTKYKIPGSHELIDVVRGQFITGQQILFSGLYKRPTKDTPNSRTVWRWLQVLSEFGCVNLLTVSNRCTLVTVCNYESYQEPQSDNDKPSDTPVSKQATHRCHAGVKAPPTSEEVKKVKKERKNIHTGVFTPPTVEEVAALCRERGNKIDPGYFVDYYATRGWRLKSGVTMKDWQAAVRTWESNNLPQVAKTPQEKPKSKVLSINEIEALGGYNPYSATGLNEA